MKISKCEDKYENHYIIDCENCNMHSRVTINIFSDENENVEEHFKNIGWRDIFGKIMCPKCADSFYNPSLNYSKLTNELGKILPNVEPYLSLSGYKPPMVLYEARLKNIDDYFRDVSRIDELAVSYIIENLVKQIDSLERKVLEMEINK